MTKSILLSKDEAEVCGQRVHVVKNSYTWLWEIRYVDGATLWAGPYKTRKEARKRLAERVQA